jgi:hypothetical protein
MRWRVLGALLGLILLGAMVFSVWPTDHVVSPEADSAAPVAVASPSAPAPPTERPAPTVPPASPPAPVPIAAAPAPARAAAETDLGQLDEEPDFAHLRALGLTEADIEPADGGALHALTREGIKGAIAEELPQIRECYEGWLQQNPNLSGKLKVEFTILEIPGRDRAKIQRVEIADGGMGHVAMEGCVRNVFKGMRFEAPRGGEMRVTYPLSFEAKGP